MGELKMKAWGGTVVDGDECWIMKKGDWSIIHVCSVRLVDVGGDAQLLFENRVYRWDAIYTTYEAARLALIEDASHVMQFCRDRAAQAKRCIDNHSTAKV